MVKRKKKTREKQMTRYSRSPDQIVPFGYDFDRADAIDSIMNLQNWNMSSADICT